jgi:hypothetical protein
LRHPEPSPPSRELAAEGTADITVRLTAIGGYINKLKFNIYIIKYNDLDFHDGRAGGQDMFGGHYNRMKPRATAADRHFVKVGGNVDRSQAGEVYCMALKALLDKLFMGSIIDRHINETGTRYWAIWTDRAGE